MTDGAVSQRRLVVVTQVVDCSHPNLGFVVAWLRGLAERWPGLRVVARAGDPTEIAGIDCEILSWKGSRARKAVALAAAIDRAMQGGVAPIVLAHQCPAFALTAWPIVKRRTGHLALFYAHGHRSMQFRASERLVDVMLTSTPEGCPTRRPVRIIGQGISPIYFTDAIGKLPVDIRLVTCGRVAPVKNLHRIIDTLAVLRRQHPSASLEIYGRPETPEDQRYGEQLRDQVEREGLASSVRFAGACSPETLAMSIRGAFAAINMSDTHSLDKAILEAAACGVPVVTSNRSARALLARSDAPWLSIEASAVAAESALLRLMGESDFECAARSWRAIADEHTLARFLERLSAELGSTH